MPLLCAHSDPAGYKNVMSAQRDGWVNAQLVADHTEGVWTRCRLWNPDTCLTEAQEFEVDEPVYLDRPAFLSDPDERYQIYYVVGFFYEPSGYGVEVGFERAVAAFTASVACLRKLDPLTRLAAEGSAGPLI